MRRLLIGAVTLVALGAFLVLTAGASNPSPAGSYKIELDNAFGLVSGSQFKVAGVPAGTITSIDLDQKTLHAVVTVNVTATGFGQFHADAFCQSRPQSLIGEYFISCQPGNAGPVLKPGSTIPVTRTQSTVPADLVQNIMRLPYRERLTLIINELGAGVAGRSDDLQAALRRAVPALAQTDNLLKLLADDSKTIESLTANSNSVVTALADDKANVQRFIIEATRTAEATATQQASLRQTFALLPGFLEQLRPAMAQLGAASQANTPVVENLNASAGQLDRLLTNLPPFARAALPAIRSLGSASVIGKQAVIAATPTVQALARFAQPTPELAQNLAIVLRDLDNRGRAVEPNTRSPGGKGYTGLEALLQYVFNQALAINTFGPFGHLLAVDAFISPQCSPYASLGTVATNLKTYGAQYRQCYSWLGPNQPGINERDPTNPTLCVPDPGGVPPGLPGPKTHVCKLSAAEAVAFDTKLAAAATPTSSTATSSAASAAGANAGATRAPPSSGGASASGSGSSTQQLLNYLLAP